MASIVKPIRNFAIIAHIDHGKSTLADRMIELCGGLTKREMTEQVLSSMELERERGITIKAQTVRLYFTASDGIEYILNIMDTPGHVDFSYEVSRSLAAVEGSVLVVDASQGVEAQTLANVYKAIENDHEIVCVLNKIDLPASEPEQVKAQIEETIGLDASKALAVSAKTGEGVPELLQAIVERLEPPVGDPSASLRAMLVDSWYDVYLGVVVLVRVIDGSLRSGQKIRMMSRKADYDVESVGVCLPKKTKVEELSAGEVGYFVGSIRDAADCSVGDTICLAADLDVQPLPGFRVPAQTVFCGLFPVESADFERLRLAMSRLRLNDSGFSYDVETSVALGMGFQCGFLGLLHLEIIQERLYREFDLNLVATAPSVVYHVGLTDGTEQVVTNPIDMPPTTRIRYISEPWLKATMITPDDYLGAVIKLCQDRRGRQVDMNYSGGRVVLTYDMPLSEVVFDFYDRLKSVTRGYSSFDYELADYEEGNLVTMTILVNGEPVDALAMLVHRDKAEARGRAMCEKMKTLIPGHQFKIPIQAAINGKIIARETVPALRKDVTAKCYGGDVSRKRKLLEKQKEGKKRMRQYGRVNIPQDAFIAALKFDG